MDKMGQPEAFALIQSYFSPLKIHLEPDSSQNLKVTVVAHSQNIVLDGVLCPTDLTNAKVFELISSIESRIAKEAPHFSVSEEADNVLRQYR